MNGRRKWRGYETIACAGADHPIRISCCRTLPHQVLGTPCILVKLLPKSSKVEGFTSIHHRRRKSGPQGGAGALYLPRRIAARSRSKIRRLA